MISYRKYYAKAMLISLHVQHVNPVTLLHQNSWIFPST